MMTVSLLGLAGEVQATIPDPPYDRCLNCPAIDIDLDKYTYVLGENVKISGQISSEIFKSGEPVVIRIFSPVEELVSEEVQPAPDGTFSYLLNLDGELLSIPHRYNVLASYGSRNAGESFSYLGEESVNHRCSSCQYVIYHDNTKFEVDYQLNGIIQNITIDAQANRLVIEAVVNSSASFLDVSLNPKLIRATELDQTGQERNVNFTVLVNGKNAEKTNTSFPAEIMPADTDRRLFIEKLEKGQNRVEIIGTRVIPEFEILAMIITAISIAGVVIWSQLDQARQKASRLKRTD